MTDDTKRPHLEHDGITKEAVVTYGGRKVPIGRFKTRSDAVPKANAQLRKMGYSGPPLG